MENGMSGHTKNRMGTMPVGKLLVKISLPLAVSMLIQACYNIVDSIFVAKVSENALTAVSLAFPLQMLIISVAVGTGVGINSLISRRLGEQRYEEANKAASNALFLMLLSALTFMLIGFTLVDAFFSIFTDDPEIYAMGTSYLSIVLIFSFGVFMQIGCERIVQATGNTIYPMIMQLVGAVINLVLDPILIFGYFGLPAMGVTGAAVATVAGQIIAMFLSFYIVFKKKHAVKVSFRGFRPDRGIIKDIYAVGVPSIIMQSIGTVMTVGLNKILISFTPTAVSVLGAYFKLNSFIFMPVFAINSGALSIMGYNFGARNRKRVLHTLRLAILAGMALMAAGTLIFQLIPDKLLLLFEAGPEMLRIGVSALQIISISFPFAAVCIAFSNLFQAIGRGTFSLFMSLVRQLVVILPVAFLLSHLVGFESAWWAFPVSELFAITLVVILFRYVNGHMLRPLDDAPAVEDLALQGLEPLFAEEREQAPREQQAPVISGGK